VAKGALARLVIHVSPPACPLCAHNPTLPVMTASPITSTSSKPRYPSALLPSASSLLSYGGFNEARRKRSRKNLASLHL
jgi:hypothetical protein